MPQLRWFLLVGLLSCPWIQGAAGSDFAFLMKEADKLRHGRQYAESVAVYQKAFPGREPSDNDYYNAACSAALAGDAELAFQWLRQAVARGYSAPKHLQADPDLTSLHGQPAWAEIVTAVQKAKDRREAAYDKPLQAELLAIHKDDQEERMKLEAVAKQHGWQSKEVRALWEVMAKKDEANQARIIAILEKHGWVGPDKVGRQASMTIFLVIQHADLPAQQKYLPLMRAAVKEKKAEARDLALLEDRVALAEGRRQRYGSQIARDSATGRFFVQPLEDADRVDEYRAEVGLGPLSEYVKRWEIEWDPATHKKQLEDGARRDGGSVRKEGGG